jgi:hypothetical protein
MASFRVIVRFLENKKTYICRVRVSLIVLTPILKGVPSGTPFIKGVPSGTPFPKTIENC